jgi:glutamine phosphoribosylpyrophosphate amidotransferase
VAIRGLPVRKVIGVEQCGLLGLYVFKDVKFVREIAKDVSSVQRRGRHKYACVRFNDSRAVGNHKRWEDW